MKMIESVKRMTPMITSISDFENHAQNQINKYVWFLETLYKAKKITLKEINWRWLETHSNYFGTY